MDATWDAEAVTAALLDSVRCGVLLFGLHGELRGVSAQFTEIMGREKSELLALGSFDNLVEHLSSGTAQPAVTAERWRERRRAGEPCWDELDVVFPQRKHLERFARPILDSRGRAAGWLEVYRDVTGQKIMEGSLFHIERLVTLGQSVSNVAHELSNPLTCILGYAQLLRGRRGARQGQEGLERILQEAERASRIARSLLQFGSGAKPEYAAVDLNEVVRGVLRLRAGEPPPEEVELRLELESGLPPVLGDFAQLQQILLNLVVNSEQAIRQDDGHGTIRLRTRRAAGDCLAVEVADDGPGIAADVLPRVFDPFFTTKPAGVGSGLGLSIVYGIAHDHGGKVSVESRPGCGATFTVELPVAPAPPLSARSLAVQEQPGRPAAAGCLRAPGRGERILVIEDEPAVAHLIADVLAEEEHQADVVLNSREGLDLIGKNRYGLILCDLRMPHLSGRALFEELQRRGDSLAGRFVFVTGDALSPNTAQFLKRSGVPYLAKPFLIDELKEIVHGALDQAGGLVPVASARAEAGWSRRGQKGRRVRRF